MSDGFVLIRQHRDGCWGHEAGGFACYDGTIKRGPSGKRPGLTKWHCFLCNDPDCDAVALVRWDILSDLVNVGIASTTAPEAQPKSSFPGSLSDRKT